MVSLFIHFITNLENMLIQGYMISRTYCTTLYKEFHLRPFVCI